FPRQRISPSKESRTAQIGNPKPQENPHAHPAFLQNRLLAQVKSSRSINRFRILHGRLLHRIGLAPTTHCRSPGALRQILHTTTWRSLRRSHASVRNPEHASAD